MIIQKNDNQKGRPAKENFRKKKNTRRRPKQDSEFDQKVIDIARVTRVTAGGKRLRFRACVVIGDKKGRVAYGIKKGSDVTVAVNKAVAKAKKDLITVKIVDETIPYQIEKKFGGARVLLKPAPVGTGIIAGGVVRSVIELAGIKNLVGKIKGSKSKINNVKAVIAALAELKTREDFKNLRK